MKTVIFTTINSQIGKEVINKIFEKGDLKKILYKKAGYNNKGLIYSLYLYTKKYGIKQACRKIYEKIISPFQQSIKINKKISKNFYQNISSCNNKKIEKLLKKNKPELCIVTSFGKILDPKIIKIPKYFINIHPSLLPKYRGGNPFYWVLRNKERETGITYHYINEKIDAGNIIMQKKIIIDRKDTEATIKYKLAIKAGEMLNDVLNRIKKNYRGVKQDIKKITFAPDHK